MVAERSIDYNKKYYCKIIMEILELNILVLVAKNKVKYFITENPRFSIVGINKIELVGP
jgi:hypothetical protein